MNKNDMDWKSFAEELLWFNVVSHKNKDSGYDIIKSVNYPDGARGHKVGDIGHFRFCSYYVGEFEQLTWKELALELGLFEYYLTPDGHDCKICPNRTDCFAFFRGDEDHERCNWWEQNMNDDEKTEGDNK